LIQSVQGRPGLIALNKTDLVTADRICVDEEALEWAGLPILRTSATTGTGIPELRAAIVAQATGGASAEPGMLTSLRHHRSVTQALEGLRDATVAVTNGIPHEMVMLDLYRTLWGLDSLTGQTTPDDVLNLIFSSFCIGK
jgi:tRNA modification GTPase